MIDEAKILKLDSDLSRLRAENIELKSRIEMLADMVMASRQYVPPPRRKVPVLDLTGGADGDAPEPDDVSVELTPTQSGGDDDQLRVKGFGGSGRINSSELTLPSATGYNPEHTTDEFLVRTSNGAMAYRRLNAPVGSGGEELLYNYRLKRFGNNIGIYLTESHLMVDGQYVNAWTGLPVFDPDNGYFNLGNLPGGQYVFLNIVKETNGYSASLGFNSTAGAKWSIRIGYVNYTGWTGSPVENNYVVGALVLNSGTGTPATTADVDVVTDVAYSESTHKCTQTKRKLTVLADSAPSSYNSEVFQATDHQNEHS